MGVDETLPLNNVGGGLTLKPKSVSSSPRGSARQDPAEPSKMGNEQSSEKRPASASAAKPASSAPSPAPPTAVPAAAPAAAPAPAAKPPAVESEASADFQQTIVELRAELLKVSEQKSALEAKLSLAESAYARKPGNARKGGRAMVAGAHSSVMEAEDPTQDGDYKTAEEISWITKCLAGKSPFSELLEDQLLQNVKAMRRAEFQAGSDVLTEGSKADQAFLMVTGDLAVLAQGKEVDHIAVGQVFGEVALLYDVPRTATVRAVVKSTCWVINRSVFQAVSQSQAVAWRKQAYSFLLSIPLFSKLNSRQISRIADVTETADFPANSTIITEGQVGDCLFLIMKGKASVSQKQAGKSTLLREIGEGDYFGERSLLLGEPRSATVTAMSDTVKTLRLDKNTFTQLLGPLHAELITRMKATDSPQSKRLSVMSAAPARRLIEFSDLSPVVTLGAGGYARVVMVRHEASRCLFALKVVQKHSFLKKHGQKRCEWIIREKQLLEEVDHPFIVKLHQTYALHDRLYFLVDLCLAGDLFRLLDSVNFLHERQARFYTASLVLALEHLQALDIVYRDLKPENVLIDSQGYIKMCDFGFAKKLGGDRTYTRCGTPDYTAPEMLINEGVSCACDWWALGVVTFEILTGSPPFTDPDGDEMQTYRNILNAHIDWDSNLGIKADAIPLLKGLLTVKIAYRLGYLSGGAQDVISHKWFASLDWVKLVNKAIPPPWQPTFDSSDMVSYFAEFQHDEPIIDASTDKPEDRVNISSKLNEKWEEVQAIFQDAPLNLDRKSGAA